MIDPAYALILAGLVLMLVIAATIPAPTRPAEDDAGVGLALLAASCAAALAMGVLALLGRPGASALLGATAWLLVMPCVWLARAPQPPQETWEDDEQDDDGGSPAPRAPSAPPAPSDRLPAGPSPAATQAGVAWLPTPQSAPVTVLATAARVQQLLAARESERLLATARVQQLLAAQEAERLLAAAAQIPLPEVPPRPLSRRPLRCTGRPGSACIRCRGCAPTTTRSRTCSPPPRMPAPAVTRPRARRDGTWPAADEAVALD